MPNAQSVAVDEYAMVSIPLSGSDSDSDPLSYHMPAMGHRQQKPRHLAPGPRQEAFHYAIAE